MMPDDVQFWEQNSNPKDPMQICRGTLVNVCEQIKLW